MKTPIRKEHPLSLLSLPKPWYAYPTYIVDVKTNYNQPPPAAAPDIDAFIINIITASVHPKWHSVRDEHIHPKRYRTCGPAPDCEYHTIHDVYGFDVLPALKICCRRSRACREHCPAGVRVYQMLFPVL